MAGYNDTFKSLLIVILLQVSITEHFLTLFSFEITFLYKKCKPYKIVRLVDESKSWVTHLLRSSFKTTIVALSIYSLILSSISVNDLESLITAISSSLFPLR